MPDLPSSEDDAALYVLNGLSAAERRDFEVQLAQSSDLRALVRDLEEGTTALALASIKKQPPPRIWNGIALAVSQATKRETLISRVSFDWKQWGWAAAACLAGWILYAFWIQRTGSTSSSRALHSEVPSTHGVVGHANSPLTKTFDSGVGKASGFIITILKSATCALERIQSS